MSQAWNQQRTENKKCWQHHIEKWKASGLSQAEYCRKDSPPKRAMPATQFINDMNRPIC